MNEKVIGIAGFGYVGKAAAEFFAMRYPVKVYDPKPFEDVDFNRGYTLVGSLEELNGCDLLVVCVPTPMKADRTCDTSIVEEVIRTVDAKAYLIKSTIVPGTTERLVEATGKDLTFSPEYIGEGKYFDAFGFANTMYGTPFWIVGGSDEAVDKVYDLVVPIGGPSKTYYRCTAREAEVIKYMENLYFGIKITFAQQMYDACQALGVNWYRVREGWALDPRVDKMHTAVFPDKRGFGGKCLPKDLNAFVKVCEQNGFDFELLRKAIEINETRYNPDAKPYEAEEQKEPEADSTVSSDSNTDGGASEAVPSSDSQDTPQV